MLTTYGYFAEYLTKAVERYADSGRAEPIPSTEVMGSIFERAMINALEYDRLLIMVHIVEMIFGGNKNADAVAASLHTSKECLRKEPDFICAVKKVLDKWKVSKDASAPARVVVIEGDRTTMDILADEYQKEALRTEAGMDKTYPRIFNGLMGLNGEAGECVDILKKHAFQGHELDKEHLAEELGDVAWYLAVSADAIGYKLSDILGKNVDKLRKRYPDGFDSERSKNREL